MKKLIINLMLLFTGSMYGAAAEPSGAVVAMQLDKILAREEIEARDFLKARIELAKKQALEGNIMSVEDVLGGNFISVDYPGHLSWYKDLKELPTTLHFALERALRGGKPFLREGDFESKL